MLFGFNMLNDPIILSDIDFIYESYLIIGKSSSIEYFQSDGPCN